MEPIFVRGQQSLQPVVFGVWIQMWGYVGERLQGPPTMAGRPHHFEVQTMMV